MTKAKSTSAAAGLKQSKLVAKQGNKQRAPTNATATATDVAQQQKKAVNKRMHQSGRSLDATANISARPIKSKNSATAIAAADASTAAAPSKLLLSNASSEAPASHPAIDCYQDRAVTGTPRAGTKLAIVLGMLREDGGASIVAIMQATGWLSHTTRAVLTGLKKRGFEIERQAGDKDSPSVYRITTNARHLAGPPASSSQSTRAINSDRCAAKRAA